MVGIFKKAAVAVIALGCGVAMGQTRIQGAGATFPEPLYKKWVADYQKAHNDIQIDYQGIGSGGGIKGITDKTVDFAGSDAPMNKKEIDKAGGADNLVQVPSVAGGVVPAYNLPGVQGELKFSGEVLADIYLGKITNWNDPKIAALNDGMALPDTTITAVHRTDGSGTTYVFTNYLATQSDAFRNNVGAGKAVEWPGGIGGKGNPGVTAAVQSTPGAIGYIEQAYADQNKVAYGAVKNKNGKFVKATPASVSAAGSGAVDAMQGHLISADIWSQPGDEAYPIASFTYLIVYKDLSNIKTKAQAQALVDFMAWALLGDGQNSASDMDYAPLAKPVQEKVKAAMETLTYQGQPIKPSGL